MSLTRQTLAAACADRADTHTGEHQSGYGVAVDELLTVDDVAERFKLPRSWVYERTRRRGGDRLPFVKLGKYVRFVEADARAFIERQRHGGTDR